MFKKLFKSITNDINNVEYDIKLIRDNVGRMSWVNFLGKCHAGTGELGLIELKLNKLDKKLNMIVDHFGLEFKKTLPKEGFTSLKKKKGSDA
ncbi:MAG: hypothetical protein ACTSW1_08375 [Candidatus Hodarchaeales archaeon]